MEPHLCYYYLKNLTRCFLFMKIEKNYDETTKVKSKERCFYLDFMLLT